MHAFLKELGFRSKHSVFEIRKQIDPVFMEKADAFGDSPVPLLYPVLDQRYPDSKFILTVRDKEKWLKSMAWMFDHGRVLWWWGPNVHAYHRQFYGTTRFRRDLMARKYDAYHAEVQAYFTTRPHDLLVIDLEKPLEIDRIKAFLGVSDHPVTDFPRENTRRYAQPKHRIAYAIYDVLSFHPPLAQGYRRLFNRTKKLLLPTPN